jgi:DNA repair protein RecN (Recombination protein N)
MLKSLTIQNLATIETLTIEFSAGLNALTGETGAGKSVLIGGLEIALGDRASADLVRPGESVAVVEAAFEPPLPPPVGDVLRRELELEGSSAEPLLLRREISRSGRNRCFINGQMVGVADLKRVGELLIDFHGQHEHQSLFRPGSARDALDAFAADAELLSAYRALWGEVSALRRRRRKLEEDAADFERRLDYLAFQLDEFEKLRPRPGEAAELELEERRLARADALARDAAESFALLYEGVDEDHPAVLAALREVARRMAELAEIEPRFAASLSQLEESRAQIEDLAYELRDYADHLQGDPERLDEVIARLESLRRLERKHGGSEEAMLAAWQKMAADRDQMQRDDAERDSIGAALAAAEARLGEAATRLSQARKHAGDRFAKAIAALLREMRMEKARFAVVVEPLPEPGEFGQDNVEFLLAANPGLPPAPLRKIASGGEISRVMLALKSALAARDSIGTLVFDEIDTGLSGETARRVGQLMEKLGQSHQILCITHHAPIAARAVRHASVRKITSREATFTEIIAVEGQERIDELARMMGSDAGTEAARELARQLMA